MKTQLLLLLLFAIIQVVSSQPVPMDLYQNMEWRMIGPFRAGRTVGAVGIPDQPSVFYMGVNNGGVWKTDDYGRTWRPLFDKESTNSIGNLALAPSDPNIIYVGSGEGLHRPDLSVGDGMFKSTDGGETWQHIGLGDAQQIGAIIVDPENPDRVFVAVLGHPYGPNEERGVFRSTDGGDTWEKVFYMDEDTGAIALAFDPRDSDIIYTDMWEARQGPWENAAWQGPNSGLFKSFDGGDTWRKLTTGLPTAADGLGRIGIGIAPSDPDRIYATVQASRNGGIYRSDDAGESWTLINTDRRLWGRGNDFAEIKVHPNDKDVVFVGNIAAYRSDDGGATFTSIKGAPGGDDYHGIWINPLQPDIMLFAADQGATITVNGGKTWSSWYNQPTAQLYHVTTDNQFPYHVYGGQQESGALAIPSRGPGGQITFRDWFTVRADEYAYVAPDPLNPDIVYGGRVTRFNRKTRQVQNVAPEAVRSGDYRILRTMPLTFSPADPTTLFFATNVLFKTTTGGQSWDIISPDLSREQPEVPESIGTFYTSDLDMMPRRGVIYALAPSGLDANLIWAGTDDGLIHVTRDGGATWSNVTPPALTAWSKVSVMDAGHFDTQTAYVAINRIRLDDMRPHIYRTHDGGQTWDKIVSGLPDDGPVNAVREDPMRPGLLYAGTEREVYVSFNDGDDWQPLRLNMPASSIRDIVVKDDDLIAGTHGRSIWILDNLTPLRQAAAAQAASSAFLFAPQTAYRVQWNRYSDTPLPPEEPTGDNPPDGAMIDYYLKEAANEVTLEIVDASGAVIRRFSSSDTPTPINPDDHAHPTYWIRPHQALSTAPGMQRFVWDLHHAPPRGARRSYPISAVYQNTPDGPQGPWAHPGTYTIRLTADGVTSTQTLTVQLDPRVDVTRAALQEQHDYSMAAYNGYHTVQDAREHIDTVQAQIQTLLDLQNINHGIRDQLTALSETLNAFVGTSTPGNPDIVYGSAYAEPEGDETLTGLQRNFLFLMAVLQGADAQPTTQAKAAVDDHQQRLGTVLDRWQTLQASDITALNQQLEQAGLSPLPTN